MSDFTPVEEGFTYYLLKTAEWAEGYALMVIGDHPEPVWDERVYHDAWFWVTNGPYAQQWVFYALYTTSADVARHVAHGIAQVIPFQEAQDMFDPDPYKGIDIGEDLEG